jgi:hypothetical protein
MMDMIVKDRDPENPVNPVKKLFRAFVVEFVFAMDNGRLTTDQIQI